MLYRLEWKFLQLQLRFWGCMNKTKVIFLSDQQFKPQRYLSYNNTNQQIFTFNKLGAENGC